MQASKLWNEKFIKVISHEGYEHSPRDPCVMKQTVRDKIFSYLIMWIKIFVDETVLKCIKNILRKN